ncbi:hypothetical protein [Glaciecola sp. 1036]|uniref:hypothetical protein n=1 Tax=Alteromonadaceae TaxID=72275 RepID=UPI003D06E344
MLYQRISRHFKRQDWFAAFLDLLIVVAGIFIGLQVTEWNIARLEAKQEKAYLEQILLETTLSIDRNSYHIDKLNEWIGYHKVAIQALETGELKPEDMHDVAKSFESLLFSSTPHMQKESIEDLTSSGKFSVFKNTELVSSIKDAVTLHNTILTSFNAMQLRIYSKSSYLDGMVASFDRGDDFSRFADFDFAALSKDRTFIRHLKNIVITLEVNKRWIDTLRNAQINVQDMLQAELERAD